MKNISVKKLAIIITASVVALVLLVLGIITTVDYIKNDKGFDYNKSNLSKYIEFTADYKNFDLNIDIAKPRDIDIDISMLNMLCEDKPTNAWLKESTANLKINPGDVVYIYYRGFIVDDEGNKTELDGMCNFADANPTSLEIGSNGFVPGFELDLVGESTGGLNKYYFEKITTGKATDAEVVYISYVKKTTNENNTTSTTTVSADNPKRIDYSAEDITTLFGEGFLEKVQSLTIGTKSTEEFKTTVDGKEVTYSDLTVQFGTTCEDEGNYIEVSCYFPYDYGKADFNNKDAIFYVYVQKADFYYTETPVFDDDYLKKKTEDKDIAITEEKLNEYEGETLVDKYRAYAEELMQKLYENEYNSMVESAIWDYYSNNTKILKYPTAKVDEVYYEYASEIQTLYYTNGGKIYNSYYGNYDTYNTLNDYANAYMGIGTSSEWYSYGDTAWQYSLYSMAQDFVKERLMLYYIMRAEDLIPDKNEIAAEIETIKQEYLDEYIDQYLENEKKTQADYSEEEWEQFKKDRANEIFNYYKDSHFEERAYYAIAADAMIKWPNIKTLDDPADVE